jgi:hypothetical protein
MRTPPARDLGGPTIQTRSASEWVWCDCDIHLLVPRAFIKQAKLRECSSAELVVYANQLKELMARESFLLRTDPKILAALRRRVEDELRSTNGQLDFVLRAALRDVGRMPKQDNQDC